MLTGKVLEGLRVRDDGSHSGTHRRTNAQNKVSLMPQETSQGEELLTRSPIP